MTFDRAAGYYDRTRGLHPDTVRAQTAVLAAELRDRGRCLEIGVGTGRIAVPLHEAGVAMAGVDLSLPMLQRLATNAGGSAPLPHAQADAARLPFADATFGGALACHVLHLVADWRGAVAELWRVLRPGGVLLVDAGGGWPPEHEEIAAHFAQATGTAEARELPGLAEPADLDVAMAARGAAVRWLDPVTNVREGPLDDIIGQLAEGLHSWTWSLDETTRQRASAATRAWAADRYGDLDAPRRTVGTIRWRAYDRPAA